MLQNLNINPGVAAELRRRKVGPLVEAEKSLTRPLVREHAIEGPAAETLKKEIPGEAKEIADDPTREKLETANDEKDEQKGGVAELAADLRVSIRIERMNLGRYKRMLKKHELSDDVERWLKQLIERIEDDIKTMESKLPDLEKQAKREAVREHTIAGVKAAITEIAKG